MHRHPPSPTALTPRRCFNNANTTNAKPRAWDRQPRTAASADGKARTIWKRFEGNVEQEKENVVPVKVDIGAGAKEEIGGKEGMMSPKKAVKKMCLGGGEVEVKSWERRGSGLVHKVPQMMAEVPLLVPTSVVEAQVPVLEELEESLEPASPEDMTCNEDATSTDDHDTETQKTPLVQETDAMMTDAGSAQLLVNEDDQDAQLPDLVPMQVWSRSSMGLRDETIDARAACSTPKRKSPMPRPCLSPATQLDQITPSFLKKMFSVLNESMASTPRGFAAASTQQSLQSPTKRLEQPVTSEEVKVDESDNNSLEEHHEELKKTEIDVAPEDGQSAQAETLQSAVEDVKDQSPPLVVDDTQLLLDFLSRTEASKAKRAANIARRSSLSHRRDSGAVRGALASPQKPFNAPEAEVLMSPEKIAAVLDCIDDVVFEQVEELPAIVLTQEAVNTANEEVPPVVDGADLKTNRRSTRIPKQTKVYTPETPNAITIFRTDGQELRVLKDAEARALATTTRSNTRRNKGGAVNVIEMLKKLKQLPADPVTVPNEDSEEKKSVVQWKDDIAQYCEIAAREEQAPAAPDQAASGMETDKIKEVAKSIPRPRRPARPAVRKIKTVSEVAVQPNTSKAPSEVTPSAQAPVNTIGIVATDAPSAAPKTPARTLRLPQPVRGKAANVSKPANNVDTAPVPSAAGTADLSKADTEGLQLRRPASRRVRSR